MDKFFIQAAFKTLDDIDKEENKEIKKALIESRLKEKKKREKKYPLGKGEHLNTCAGDPDVNTAAFNYATTLNTDSATTGALAEDKEKLEEKIPRDVKKAYENTKRSTYADNLPYEDLKIEYAYRLGSDGDQPLKNGQSPIDFEKANYRVISKEEAQKYARPSTRWRLILLFTHSYGLEGPVPQAIRFSKEGKPLSKVTFKGWRYNDIELPTRGENEYTVKSSTQLPVSLLIDMADKIYLTDELQHLNNNYFSSFKQSEIDEDPDARAYYIKHMEDSSLPKDAARARDSRRFVDNSGATVPIPYYRSE